MARINLILIAILILCALSLVTSQYKARKLYADLQQEQETAYQLDTEWGQLQLEQSTWAQHARIETIANTELHMQLPSSASTRIIAAASR